MFAEVDVFISNYTLVDPEVYQLWIDGSSSSEAVKSLQEGGVIHQTGATLELVASDVLDHYRTYSLLEKLLHNPPKLSEQLAFQIEPQTRGFLIEKYYDFDDAVIRELLGKKLSSRHRKDLDEVSDKTHVQLKSCRRQFDNVKRVFKTVEEMQGSVVKNVAKLFLLPEPLARRYGAVVFLARMRFETGKRKLQYLSFPDFCHCAEAMMSSWTYKDSQQDYDDTDLDREFLLVIREFRVLLDSEKELKLLVCSLLKPQLLEHSFQELESNFRSYSRSILGIACNLHHSRDQRNFFLDLVERCIEPWRQAHWSRSDLSHFLDVYSSSVLQLIVGDDLKGAWNRYMSVIASCLLRMFHT